MIRLIKMNLSCLLRGAAFWCIVLVTFGILLFSYIEVGDKSYTVLVAAFTLDRETLLSDSTFSSYEVFRSISNGSFFLFSAMLAIFPFVSYFSGMRDVHFTRFILMRSKKLPFILGQIFSFWISGVCAVMIGVLGYLVFTLIAFPSLGEYASDIVAEELDILQLQYPTLDAVGDIWRLYCRDIGTTALYTLSMTSLGCLCLACFRNRYVILTLPFFGCYLMRQLSVAFSSVAFVDPEHFRPMLYNISILIKPEATFYLTGYSISMRGAILAVQGGFLVLCGVLWIILAERRVDASDI